MNLIYVTGSSSGIGQAICEYLLDDPHNHVIGIARRNSISESNFEFKQLDLNSRNQVESFQFLDSQKYENISLINNAGMLGDIRPNSKQNLEQIEEVLEVDLIAPILLSSLFIKKYQKDSKRKSIINISSGASTSAYASWSNYCTAKAGLEMFTKCIELEQKDQESPIHCFSIAPGVVDTDMQAHIRNSNIEDFAMKPKFEELYSEKKLYHPMDVAIKIAEVVMNPESFEEKVFRITV